MPSFLLIPRLFLTALTALPISLGSAVAVSQTSPNPAAEPAHGIAVPNLDPHVRPGDNFFLFCNGSYIAHTKLPEDRARIGLFNTLTDQSINNVQGLIDEAGQSSGQAGAQKDPDRVKIADLYHSYMDEPALAAHGLTSLRIHLAEIDRVANATDLARALGSSLRADVDALNNTNFHTSNLFGVWVAPGFNDPDHYAAYLLQGGLELPNRDYYLSDSGAMSAVRQKYRAHVAAMLRLAGLSDADGRAARVFDLETAIARVHLSLAANEDIKAANNPWTLADFAKRAPGLDWQALLTAAGLPPAATYIVWQPAAFTGEAALVQSQPVEAWKDFLRYHLIEDYARGESKELADEQFAFFGKTLSGTPAERPRSYRAALFVSGTLADAVGKLYVAKYFSADDKAAVQALVANLITAFHERLEQASWMADSTRKEALAKLATLQVGVGYPDHWRSYSELEIKPDDLFGNLWRDRLFELHYSIGRIGLVVDKKEWVMPPQLVNAVNLPLDNGLNFPAAILQPPFFDPKAPAAANYGAIGTIIGHEISHTFDSEGASFDSHGRVRDWWTAEDFAHFKQVTAALAAQYNQYRPFPDLAVNGEQTLGENIADVAGLTAALDGLHAALKKVPGSNVGDYTPEQQFFIAFGQNWASVSRDAALRQQVLTDPHAPAQYRAATVRNIDAWYPAFDVKPGEALYLAPDARVHIW